MKVTAMQNETTNTAPGVLSVHGCLGSNNTVGDQPTVATVAAVARPSPDATKHTMSETNAQYTKTAATHDTAIILTPPVLKVLWAAMAAMVKDIHAPQDMLSPLDWEVAEKVFMDLDEEINSTGRGAGGSVK